MKTNKLNATIRSAQQVSFPPERVRKFLLSVKASLGREAGQPMSFDDWGRFAGRPGSTLASWCDNGEAYQLQALLASLERLSALERHQLIDEVCRTHSSLRHSKIAHDFIAVTYLMGLLSQRNGFTAIRGRPEHMRTFLLAALGNSFRASNPQEESVTGIDIHSCEFLTPVRGVVYLNNPLSPSDLAGQIQRAWLKVVNVEATLFLFNDVWSKMPSLQSDITALARRAHVVVADSRLDPPTRHLQGPAHLITVSAAQENPDWLRVDVQQS